jgi:multicomponent K+:H+ antiporter subunit G
MNWFGEALVSALILIGAFFLFVGSFGLAKLPDMMRRLHAPTKSTTLGIGSMLIASMVYFLVFVGNPSVHELLIMLFLFLTAPVTAHMIAKAHILRHRRTQEELSPTQRPAGWATLDPAMSKRSSRPRLTVTDGRS